ncbi:MAG TPA: hypothetical protein VK400_14620 [Pyrinomonadaceae bacterium]|nr:hypothetical protein [Pyrinomonadaceae bacterium]
MKTGISKFISLGLFIAILITSPQFLLAQTDRLVGELTITTTGEGGFVTVNGERVVSGRSITSPSEIVTSPQARARIALAQTGTILIEPNSRLNLSFAGAGISGEFAAGEVTIETVPNTTVNILTADGTLTLPNRNQANIVKISRDASARTRINTLTGQAMFNNVLVSAGEFYPQPDATPDRTAGGAGGANRSGGTSPILLIALLGAAAGAAVLALAASSGNNDNPPPVSPTR